MATAPTYREWHWLVWQLPDHRAVPDLLLMPISNNGAIYVLSSGSIGTLIIAKPISIVGAAGTFINGIAGGAGIIVQAGPATIISLLD